MKLAEITATIRVWLYYLAQCVSARVTLLDGVPQGGTVRVRCLLIGEGYLHDYIKTRFVGAHGIVNPGPRESVWKIFRRLTKGRDDFDLCFIVPPLAIKGWAKRHAANAVCPSIGLMTDTADWAQVRGNISSRKRTQVNQFDRSGPPFSILKSREDADLRLFHETMYVPFVRRRFGFAAVVPDLADFRRRIRSGFILFAIRNSKPVGGALLVSFGSILQFRWIGILEADETSTPDGVQTALYYQMLKYANRHGFSRLDLTNNAPFLTDGIYRFKAQWGGVPYPSNEHGREEYLFLGTNQRSIAAYFRDFPLVVRHADGLAALAGIEPGVTVDEAWIQRFRRGYPIRGLNAIIPIGPNAGLLKEIVL